MVEEFKHTTGKRKYICRYAYEYSESNMCEFISKLGKNPDRYEIITIFRTDSGRYEAFYKEYFD